MDKITTNFNTAKLKQQYKVRNNFKMLLICHHYICYLLVLDKKTLKVIQEVYDSITERNFFMH